MSFIVKHYFWPLFPATINPIKATPTLSPMKSYPSGVKWMLSSQYFA